MNTTNIPDAPDTPNSTATDVSTSQPRQAIPPEIPVPNNYNWPGTHEWTDEEYKAYLYWDPGKQFNEDGLWDWDEVLPGDPAYMPDSRPIQISVTDWDLIAHTIRTEDLSLKQKLVYVAYAKFQIEQASAGTQTPLLPIAPVTPWQDWLKTHTSITDHSDKSQEVATAHKAIIAGQPYRHAVHPDATTEPLPTYGAVTHPDTVDLLEGPFEDPHVEALPRKWSPDATPAETVRAAAADLATLCSVLAARTITAMGYQSDTDAIKRLAAISSSLRDITYVMRETASIPQGTRRGRPTKPSLLSMDMDDAPKIRKLKRKHR